MEIINPIKSFIAQSLRVWHILKKPTKEEFKSIAKISSIGLLALGAAGFLIALIVNLISK